MDKTSFEYRLRRSSRARYVRLRVTPEHGLEVIVPEAFKRLGEIPRLLEHKRRWIRAALDRAETHRQLFDPKGAWQVPTQIGLPAAGKTWEVVARASNGPSVRVRMMDVDQLEISGPIDNEHACRIALRRWLVRQAQEYLLPRLRLLSERTGLRYSRVSVRRQRTRWASCSRHGDISLNIKLLFLPPELADYVLLHELCHTIELNHSPRFWALVERHCADYRELDGSLRGMWYRVPGWV